MIGGYTRLDRGRQMENEVNLQTQYRAVALLTGDPTNANKIADLKQSFTEGIATLEDSLTVAPPAADSAFPPDLAHIQDANARFVSADERAAALDLPGQKDGALQLYLQQERPIAGGLA